MANEFEFAATAPVYLMHKHAIPEALIAGEKMINDYVRIYSSRGHFVSITNGLIEMSNMRCPNEVSSCVSFELISERESD